MAKKKHASAGHKLGQLVGDWHEEMFVFPLLKEAASKLNLYLDNRFVARAARGGETSILWKDEDDNEVDSILFGSIIAISGAWPISGLGSGGKPRSSVRLPKLREWWRRGKVGVLGVTFG